MAFEKKRSRSRPANLFFVEMIIALLFFSLSGTIILRVFAAADAQAKKSAAYENIILCAQSAAEAYSALGDAGEATEAVFGKNFGIEENSVYTLYLDTSCRLSATPAIVLILSENSEETACGTLSRLNMRFVYCGEEIYSMTCAAYRPSVV